MNKHKLNNKYVILSIDTEHDPLDQYTSLTAGFSIGIPRLFQVFDDTQISGKVCWLLEYNIKEGIPLANVNSPLFYTDFDNLVAQIKNRGEQFGLHPCLDDWIGEQTQLTSSSYSVRGNWDGTRRYKDAKFVSDVISSATKEVKQICGVNPVGCRTDGCLYTPYLPNALKNNGIFIDSSVRKSQPWQYVVSPNAYYYNKDKYHKVPLSTTVMEIPATGYICTGIKNHMLRVRTWLSLKQAKPLFLSFYIHNWQAVKPNGKADVVFIQVLTSFIKLLRNNGVQFVSWIDAKSIYNDMYNIDS
jgi:hypothetical protein